MTTSDNEVQQRVSTDFLSIWQTRNAERVGSGLKQKELLRSAHRFAYCVSLLAKAATSFVEHERVFLQELASDSLHLVHSLLAGDGRAAIFYLRSIIENFWRHQYFKSHVVEYGWLTSRKKYYVPLKDLREYCAWLDVYAGKLKHSRQALESFYAELSKQVHSTSVGTLVLRDSLEQIELTDDQAAGLAPKVRDVFRDVIALLIVSNGEIFSGLHVNSQGFVLSSLDVKRRSRVEADAPHLFPAEEVE